MTAPSIVWFRRDLRLSDQAALLAAAAAGHVIPVYILDDETPKHRAMGAASRWWLHHSLASLDASLREKGSRLILRRGKADEQLADIAKETGARDVHCLRHYEPWWRNAERAVAKQLNLICHDGNYLAPPGSVTTGTGGLYKIYTPFWRALKDRMPPHTPSNRSREITSPAKWPKSDELSDWKLLPTNPDWAEGFAAEWTPGEDGARDRVADFVDEAADYDHRRNLPSEEGSSRLSPHLHFGEVSPAYIWHRVADAGGSVDVFLAEVAGGGYAQNIILKF
ncbi:MAG: deoxyribodipyrimidine photo-lyase, partial [Sphingopyxis sp.]|nr:deoxyribodipyrimidine photo-lyase [Sphingopyxis sp.]